jgi:hypothetical protein
MFLHIFEFLKSTDSINSFNVFILEQRKVQILYSKKE